jgi:hypothetical protein
VEFEGRRHDTGEKLGFLKATVEFALARPDLADQLRAYLKSLELYAGAAVHPVKRSLQLKDKGVLK